MRNSCHRNLYRRGTNYPGRNFLRKDARTIAKLPEIVGQKEETVEKLLTVIRTKLVKLN